MCRSATQVLLFSALCALPARAQDASKDLVRVPPPAGLDPNTHWALLIGVDQYQDPTIADLRFTAADARAMADVLIGSGVYPKDHVLLLTPDQADPSLQPNRANILRALAWTRSLQEADTLLFFFSGHGGSTGETSAPTNVLYPSDAVFEMPADTGVSLQRVLSVLDEADAQRRVVFLDACRNRLAEGKAGAAPSWEAERYTLSEGTMVLFGTKPGGYSYEDDEAQLGALTRALLEGLEGEADGFLDPADGVVGMNELYAFSVERLQSRSRAGRVQVPYRGGEWTGADFALIPVTPSKRVLSPRNPGLAETPEVGWVALQNTAPMNFVALPGGAFQRGSPLGAGGDDERPARQIVLSPFYMAESELTRGQWRAAMGFNPPVWEGEATRDMPVTKVSWCDALRMANQLSMLEAERGLEPVYQVPDDCELTGEATWNHQARGYRLPTEAEWEYAARAGTTTAWFSGDSTQALCTYDNMRSLDLWDVVPYGRFADCRDGNLGLAAVKQYEPSPFGLFDVYGNVAEWVWDYYDGAGYETGPFMDPAGPEASRGGRKRVTRGGAHNSAPEDSRSARRLQGRPGDPFDSLGFRLVLGRDDVVLDVDTTEAAAFEADYQARTARVAESLRWVEVPLGEGVVGDDTRTGYPRSNIRFTMPFEMLATEVSNRQYATLYPWHSPVDNKPVVMVNWYRAQAFCHAQGGRLPTELEWEYAARAGSNTFWPRGYDSEVLSDYEHVNGWGKFDTGLKPPNAWGLHDMLGNAAEWVADAWVRDAFQRLADAEQPLVDSPWFDHLTVEKDDSRVYMVGADSSQPWPSRRDSAGAGEGRTNVGFRCVRGPDRQAWPAE